MNHGSIMDGEVYLGLLYYTMTQIMFSTLGDIGGTVMKLPVFLKQRDFFYPAWAYATTTSILKIPVTFVEVTIWIAATYYTVGFGPYVGR
jgi:hypothetical protein